MRPNTLKPVSEVLPRRRLCLARSPERKRAFHKHSLKRFCTFGGSDASAGDSDGSSENVVRTVVWRRFFGLPPGGGRGSDLGVGLVVDGTSGLKTPCLAGDFGREPKSHNDRKQTCSLDTLHWTLVKWDGAVSVMSVDVLWVAFLAVIWRKDDLA